jgi:hypothetical protein
MSLVGLVIEKLEDHDIGAPIFGASRVVPISRCIRVLFITTADPHDLERARR